LKFLLGVDPVHQRGITYITLLDINKIFCLKNGVLIVPRWRGKLFDKKEITNGGGKKLNRIVEVQECDATEAQ
jgi:hypothetical protein